LATVCAAVCRRVVETAMSPPAHFDLATVCTAMCGRVEAAAMSPPANVT
jgi:hypothetical protein